MTKIAEGYIAPILLLLSFLGGWLVYKIALSLGLMAAFVSFVFMASCHFLVFVLCVSALRHGPRGSRICALLTLVVTILIAACTYSNFW